MENLLDNCVITAANNRPQIEKIYSIFDQDLEQEMEWYDNFKPVDAVLAIICTKNNFTIWQKADGTFFTAFGYSDCEGTLAQCLEFLNSCTCEPYDEDSLTGATITSS